MKFFLFFLLPSLLIATNEDTPYFLPGTWYSYGPVVTADYCAPYGTIQISEDPNNSSQMILTASDWTLPCTTPSSSINFWEDCVANFDNKLVLPFPPSSSISQIYNWERSVDMGCPAENSDSFSEILWFTNYNNANNNPPQYYSNGTEIITINLECYYEFGGDFTSLVSLSKASSQSSQIANSLIVTMLIFSFTCFM